MMQPGDILLDYCWSWNKQHFLGSNKAETLLCSLGILAKMSAGAFNVPLWTKKKKFLLMVFSNERADNSDIDSVMILKKIAQKTYYAVTF